MNEQTSKTSSVIKKVDQKPKTEGQFKLPSYGIIIGLVIALVILKSFIYIKDEKRHGK